MNIEEHINNLKKYIEEDFAFREPIKNMSDFDKYCYGHCKDIETLLTAYEKEKEKNENLIKERAIEIVYVDKNFIRKDKIKPIQIIDLDGKIHNVYKIEEE